MPLGSAETLALAGMMGSGKSTVAELLGRLLGRRVVHLDDAIVRAAGRPIAEIFASDGEPRFRALEREAVAALPAGVVADLGGGAFCDPVSAGRLLAVGRVVFLDVSAAEAARRLSAGGGDAARPLAARWPELLARRLPLYRRAHLTVPVDGLTPEAVARRILESL
ncbi:MULTISPECIES: shikimate kinase [Anaeromyxobacter]|uniref:shikimate kinase n=1 Tax=Anaeromyxobacter TaxID=161492 RepID=UPI001F588461|nr:MULTISPECIES: shikimate kinase [unclassified Anaeromyxobacter]